VHRLLELPELDALRYDWKRLAHELERALETPSIRPLTMRRSTRCLGCWNAWLLWRPRVDARAFLGRELRQLGRHIVRLQYDALAGKARRTPMVYATFKDVRSASVCAQCYLDADAQRWRTHYAPEPRDAVWSINTTSEVRIKVQRLLVHLLLVVIVLFWSIPVQSALALANLERLSHLPGLGDVLRWLTGLHPTVKALIEGLLPVLVLLVLYAIIVPALRALSRLEFFMVRFILPVSMHCESEHVCRLVALQD